MKEKQELEKKLKEEKEQAEKERKEAEARHSRVLEQIKKRAKDDLEKQKKENEEKIKQAVEDYKKQNESKININNMNIEDDQLKMDIDKLNKESELFKSKLQDIKKQCYDEMNKKYSNILQEKIKEIHNTILKDVQQQNQKILDNYVKQFEELEQKRESDYNEMSKIMMSNVQQKDEEINFSFVKTTHKGIKCEKCGKKPIIGYRYKCSVCKDFNLCETCELKNSESQEHKHNFIKMRNEEKIEEKKPKEDKKQENKPKKEIKKPVKKEEKIVLVNDPKEEKIININEVEKTEYNYEILSKKEDLNKEVFENTDKEIEFKIMIKNNYNLKWPENQKTKLINDKNSDIKTKDIILNSLEKGQYQLVQFKLNIDKMEEGMKKCIFHFNVNNANYGEPLILTVNIKEDERISKFRNEFGLNKKDYSGKRLLDALQKVNFDQAKAFDSLFQ